ncbi:MAG: TPM domain-containing protein [Neisseriaceae bacterium]|nr:TPM domain-containing protein [Neisseriaceae bacterium]MBP6862658.1 TPM domain-containing protein [Neisseriaceae bacterium]
MTAWFRYAVAVALGLCWGWAQAALVAVPTLNNPVMDTAQMLSASEQQELSTQLRAFADANGSQVVVLTVPAIEPETPFDYATRVMDTWQLGRQGVDDGVLLLLVRDERKTHIAVGRGLEGAIPDIYTKRILMDTLAPYLRENRVYEGLVVSTHQLQKLILNEDLPEIQQGKGQDTGFGLESAMVLVFFLWAFAGRIIKAIFGKTLGSMISGGLGFGIAVFMGLSLGFSVLIGLAVLGLSILVSPAIIGSGGFGGGSGGGFGGGGFGGGGGGFSGGGGGFGGGGSSGSW